MNNKAATLKGNYRALANAATMQNLDVAQLNQVPTFVPNWRARRESNPRPLASETNTLSN